MPKTDDYPFDEVVSTAMELMKRPGFTLHQKFTCSGCDARLTIDTPNKFFEEGTCDNCSAVTNIKEQGCNYMVIIQGGGMNGG